MFPNRSAATYPYCDSIFVVRFGMYLVVILTWRIIVLISGEVYSVLLDTNSISLWLSKRMERTDLFDRIFLCRAQSGKVQSTSVSRSISTSTRRQSLKKGNEKKRPHLLRDHGDGLVV